MLSEEEITKKERQRRIWDDISFIFVAVFLACSVIFSVLMIYQKTYYKLKYVSGLSMYPTYNSHVVTPDGGTRTTDDKTTYAGDKNLDCVLVDCHDKAINSLERFDIVVAQRPDGPSTDLIKRLIALPGETFYFGSTGEDKGQLYVLGGDNEFHKVETPVEAKYLSAPGATYEGYTTPYTLKSDEYFICGDNRANSTDSRFFGPLNRKFMEGLVVAWIGTYESANNELGYINLDLELPRWYK